jgi:predicted metal-binding membrane protein
MQQAIPVPRTRRGVPPIVGTAIAGAWLLAVVTSLTGRAGLLSHKHLAEGGLPLWAALGLFVLAWQSMIAAMMLPSSLPLIRLFAVASRSQDRPVAARAAFLGGYVAVWTVFGAVAFLGDVQLHHLVDTTPWLLWHPWVIAGGVLGIAGVFQFSAIKDRCLSECRHPGAFLLQHYRRGVGAAFALGRRHGLFCLGCCWALMLVGFAAGVANLWWMAALTGLMVYEKVGRYGDRLTRVLGVSLLSLAALVLLHAGWLPTVFGQ